jgi:hypothetical protein
LLGPGDSFALAERPRKWEDPVSVDRRVLLFVSCMAVPGGWPAADRGPVSSVSVSPAFFDPSLKQQVLRAVRAGRAGRGLGERSWLVSAEDGIREEKL